MSTRLPSPGCACAAKPPPHSNLIRVWARKRAGVFKRPPDWARTTDKSIYDSTTHAALVDEFYAWMECWYFQFAAHVTGGWAFIPETQYPFVVLKPEAWGGMLTPSYSVYEQKFGQSFGYYHSEGSNHVTTGLYVDPITLWMKTLHRVDSDGNDYSYDLSISPGPANSAVTETGTYAGSYGEYVSTGITNAAASSQGTLHWASSESDLGLCMAEIWWTPLVGDASYWRITFGFQDGFDAATAASFANEYCDTVDLANLSHSYVTGNDGPVAVHNADGSYQGSVIQWNHDYEVCHAFQDGVARVALDDPFNPLNIMNQRKVLIDNGLNIDAAAGAPHYGMWVTTESSRSSLWPGRGNQTIVGGDHYFMLPGGFPGFGGGVEWGAAMQCRIGSGSDGYKLECFTRNQEPGQESAGAYPGSTGSTWEFDGATDCNPGLTGDLILKPGDMVFQFGVGWVGAECRLSYFDWTSTESGFAVPWPDGLPHQSCVIGLEGEIPCTINPY